MEGEKIVLFDEGKSYIGKLDCVNRGLYRVKARSFNYAVCRSDTREVIEALTPEEAEEFDTDFLGVREKFGEEFIFCENHWDMGVPYGTVQPVAYTGIDCPQSLLDRYYDQNDGSSLMGWIKAKVKEYEDGSGQE